MSVEFIDFSIKVKDTMEDAAIAFLEEASSEVQSAAVRKSRVDTGQLRGSWDHKVYESEKKAEVGSPLENAIWEEFGTGEYAANGDGRKGGWRYQDEKGEWHFTRGKTANHTLQKAFNSKKAAIKKRAEQVFGELGK